MFSDAFVSFLGQFGLPITMLVVLAWTGARGIWVWGRELLNERAEKLLAREERDEWKGIALTALNVAEPAVAVVATDKK